MSLSEGDEHSVSHVFGLLVPDESYLYRPEPLNQEGEELPFRVV